MNSKQFEARVQTVITTMQKIGDDLSNIPDTLVAPVFAFAKQLGGVVTAIETPLKPRIKELASKGEQITEAGTRIRELAGWVLEIRPRSGGLNRDRFFAMLQQLQVEKADACDKEVMWHPNEKKVKKLIKEGVINKKTYLSCFNEDDFSVQTPVRKVESNDEENS